MLVSITERLEDGQPMTIPPTSSLIRLMPVDDCKNLRPQDSCYLSLVTSNIVLLGGVWPEAFDGKLRSVAGLPTVTKDEQADDVIQGGPNLIQDFTGKNTKSRWDDSVTMEILERFSRICIFIDEHSVRCIVQEGFDGGFKLDDVLIGPM
jgi:hypothetical protein